jgi:hypothetical protein
VKICNKKNFFFASEINTFYISYVESKNVETQNLQLKPIQFEFFGFEPPYCRTPLNRLAKQHFRRKLKTCQKCRNKFPQQKPKTTLAIAITEQWYETKTDWCEEKNYY